MPKYEPKAKETFMFEISSENDRGIILICAAFLEEALERYICTKLRSPLTANEKGKLFSEQGILGTFSQKIWAAYFMELIGPQTRRDLDLIREMRNQTAHDMNPISFETTSEISNRCKELSVLKNASAEIPDEPRKQFMGAVRVLMSSMSIRYSDLPDDWKKDLEVISGCLDF